MNCSVCGTPVHYNGRRELIHDNYMQIANDHAASLADEHEQIGAGIPIGQTGEVMGRDGKRHACNAGYDGEGVYGWSCICGDGGTDFDSKDAATLASAEHLLDVGAMVSA